MIKVGIVGASGYTGAELIRILAGHPHVELSYLTANQYAGETVASLYPHLSFCGDLSFVRFDPKEAVEADVVFVALPHGMAMKVVPELLNGDCKVIDLSGDFRLKDESTFAEWYGLDHEAPSLLGKAVYGLPELNRGKIKGADFVTNPGCYPTSAILGVAPLFGADMVTDEPIAINSCSGVSGAGRTLSLTTHFAECNESVEAYAIGTHKHTPEIEQEIGNVAGKAVVVTFVPHLVPITRGIITTACCGLKEKTGTGELVRLYKEFYRDEPFTKVLEEGNYPKTKHVMGANYCLLGLAVDERTQKAIVVSVIDNLVKGASGQAVQNMNIMCGFDEDDGLRSIGLAP